MRPPCMMCAVVPTLSAASANCSTSRIPMPCFASSASTRMSVPTTFGARQSESSSMIRMLGLVASARDHQHLLLPSRQAIRSHVALVSKLRKERESLRQRGARTVDDGNVLRDRKPREHTAARLDMRQTLRSTPIDRHPIDSPIPIQISPAARGARPTIPSSSVLFPAPFAPSSTVISPG